MKTAGTVDSRELFSEKRRVFKRLASDRFYVYVTGLLNDLNTNPKRFWSFAKCIKGKNGQMSHLYDGDRKAYIDGELYSTVGVQTPIEAGGPPYQIKRTPTAKLRHPQHP